MNFCIISGSHRQQSNSNKIAHFIAQRLEALFDNSETDIIKISDENLPLWNEGMYQADSDIAQQWQSISKRLHGAEALVIISPEWGGMVPPGLKNFLLCCAPGEVSHKPGMIVTVSAGEGGNYPVAELRSSGYKNNQICFTPEHIVVRHADQVLTQRNLPQSDFDQFIRDRLDHGLKILERYGEALKIVRESGVVNLESYPYGM